MGDESLAEVKYIKEYLERIPTVHVTQILLN